MDCRRQCLTGTRGVKDLNKRPLAQKFMQLDVLLDQLEGILVRDLDGSSNIPRHVDHRNNRLDFLHLVPLEALQGELILVSWKTRQNKTKSDATGRGLLLWFFIKVHDLQLSGPTFQAMLLHQPTAWTQ